MIKGNEVLHNVGLAILYLLQDKILKCEDFCKVELHMTRLL